MSLFARAQKLESKGIPFVLVTMLAHRGHAPQDPGAKAIVTANGLELGTVGGGKVEAKAICFAQEILKKEQLLESEKIIKEVWNLQSDVGMTCGGEVEFLFEVNSRANWQVIIFGAGHVSQALVRLLLTMDCHITCIDQRKEWLDRLPEESLRLEKKCLENLASCVDSFSKKAFYVLMTQGHSTDYPVLEKVLLDFLPPYVGVLGSPIKSKKIRKELEEAGVNMAWIEKLYCPMGLALGTNEPSEMAVSIAAQLLEVRGKVFDEEKWKS